MVSLPEVDCQACPIEEPETEPDLDCARSTDKDRITHLCCGS